MLNNYDAARRAVKDINTPWLSTPLDVAIAATDAVAYEYHKTIRRVKTAIEDNDSDAARIECNLALGLDTYGREIGS